MFIIVIIIIIIIIILRELRAWGYFLADANSIFEMILIIFWTTPFSISFKNFASLNW